MEINDGMIVIYGDAVYFGDRAMAILSEISRSGAVLQGILRVLFRRPTLAVPVYAVLRAGRNLTLRLMGRKKIGPSPGP
jgi:hypothetical protein